MKAVDLIAKAVMNMLTREQIIEKARRDGEKPMGYLLTYIKDMCNCSKIQAWPAAEKVLKEYNINNDEY